MSCEYLCFVSILPRDPKCSPYVEIFVKSRLLNVLSQFYFLIITYQITQFNACVRAGGQACKCACPNSTVLESDKKKKEVLC